MNMFSKHSIDRFDLRTESHPRPFKVIWVGKIFLPVKEQCLVTLNIGLYSEDIYYEILPMNAFLLLGHLGCMIMQ